MLQSNGEGALSHAMAIASGYSSLTSVIGVLICRKEKVSNALAINEPLGYNGRKMMFIGDDMLGERLMRQSHAVAGGNPLAIARSVLRGG